jgi:hypothetical protein
MAGNDVPPPATFLLTRNAALDLRRIYMRSLREWGDDVADRYLADLYAAMGVTATDHSTEIELPPLNRKSLL